MSYMDRIRDCNRFEPEHFLRWFIGSSQVGWLRHEFARELRRFPDIFTITADDVVMVSTLGTFDARTDALRRASDTLIAAGLLPQRHGELYPVTAGRRSDALCLLDRALAPAFGIRAFGQHLNGYVERGSGMHMWIAKRSADKRTHPGKLDNLVAGGLPHALELGENLRKECEEEAGIPAALVEKAVPVGMVSYRLATPLGCKPDVMYCYDLELPADFVPLNRDGEVESFELLPIGKVARLVQESDRFKTNCDLVIIDFLLRHGFIDPDHPDYLEIATGLRAGGDVLSR